MTLLLPQFTEGNTEVHGVMGSYAKLVSRASSESCPVAAFCEDGAVMVEGLGVRAAHGLPWGTS